MGTWRDIQLNKKLFKNVDEQSLTTAYAALENCFVTEAGGLSRFPGLRTFVDLGGSADIFLDKLNNDLIAVGRDGRTHRIDRNANATEIQGPPVLGGRRATFARTPDSLMIAAGAQVIKFDGKKNEVLSENAPLSTHVGYVDGYVLAVENDSGRFQHSTLDKYSEWNGSDTFAANSRPDNINALMITPFNEILISGEDSIEQYERYPGGTAPFYRRWSIGDGISEPYTLCHADNAAWGLNGRYEFVRLSGQTSASASDDISLSLEKMYERDNLEALNKAWAAPVNIKGQKFIILQSPEAIREDGTKGFTGVKDLRQNQWFEITGWDASLGVPTLWPGRSVFQIWGKTFVGGQGKIYELTDQVHSNDGHVQRMYGRTAHFNDIGSSRIERVRLHLKRGVGTYQSNPKIAIRVNRNNRGFGPWQYRDLGLAGQSEMQVEFGAQGDGDQWQFEFMVTDDCQIELRRLQVEVTEMLR